MQTAILAILLIFNFIQLIMYNHLNNKMEKLKKANSVVDSKAILPLAEIQNLGKHEP